MRRTLRRCASSTTLAVLLLAGNGLANATQSPSASADAVQIQRFDLQASDVQVLFVDMQSALTKDSTSVQPDALAANAATLAHVAQLVHLPTTFSVVPVEGTIAPLMPELRPYADKSNTFARVMAGTFLDPVLVADLAKRQRRVLVVSGYATEVAVLQTVLGALKAGYTVYIPVDAMGSRSSRTEAAAFREMERAGAIPTSVLALAAQLAPDFSRAPGKDVLGTFKDLRPPQ